MINKKYNFSYTKCLKKKIFYPINTHELKTLVNEKYTIVGNFRSYNDSFIGKKKHISLSNFNKILKIDFKKKIVEVESGVILKDLNSEILNKKLMLECMPGCKFVTVGGMIANNISGKLLKNNNLKKYILSLKLINNNKLIECSSYKNKKLFDLTINGKGITGPIISAKFRLKKIKSNFFIVKKFNFNSYKKFFLNLKKLKPYKYSFCWVDFNQKKFSGIIFAANNYNNDIRKINEKTNFELPEFLIFIFSFFVTKKTFCILFNKIFKLKNVIFNENIINFDNFFFPQNRILNWNDVFKKSGFVQHHFFIKINQLHEIIDSIKKNFNKNGIFSNFAVIKFHNLDKKNFDIISISLDIPLDNNYLLVKSILNKEINKFGINVNLSKDIIFDKINLNTLKHNPVFNSAMNKYMDKNFNSNLFSRLKKYHAK